MKKIFALAALIAAVSMTASLSTSAVYTSDAAIKKGTPVVDGVREDAWDNATYYEFEPHEFGNIWIYLYDGNVDDEAACKVSFAWDEEYLYVLGEVGDNEIIDKGADWCQNDGGYWMNDNIELWLLINGDACKVTLDATGHAIRTAIDQPWGNNPAVNIIPEESVVKTAATDGGYIIEAALKVVGGLTELSTVSVGIQHNDAPNMEGIIASGTQAYNQAEFTLSTDIAIAPPAEDETPDENPGETPDTADAGIVAAAAVMAIAAGIVLKKKN